MSNRRRSTIALTSLAGLIVTLTPLAAEAYPRPATNERVSVTQDGAQGDERSIWGTISADGRYVTFESLARTLVPGDTNETTDVYLHDRTTGNVERISVTTTGAQANSWSTGPADMSDDGRYVAFESGASNLVPGDTNKVGDIFVRDRVAGTTERISVSSAEEQSTGFSWGTSMSGDGRYIAFESVSSKLVAGDTNMHWDVFVRDRVEGTTQRVSVASDGAQANSLSLYPVISDNGRYIAFESRASNLVPGDTNGADDVFVHDLQTGKTERVSVASDGTEGNAESTSYARRSISLSADGRFVAFHSLASNLVPNDTNGERDVFVHDRQSGRTERVSVSSAGEEGDGYAGFPWLSHDGRHVAFHASSSNLVADDANEDEDVFIYDRESGVTEMVSRGIDGAAANRYARFPSISADARHLAFATVASNMITDDTNDQFDVFVRDRGPVVGVSHLDVVTSDQNVHASGTVGLAGHVITSASDPIDAPAGAAPVGAEITSADVAYRPEQGDLLARLELTGIPGVSTGQCVDGLGFGCFAASAGAGGAGVIHGVSFEVEGTRYEVRALRAATTSVPPAAPAFLLYRCQSACTEISRLDGGLGTAGAEVRVAIPLETIGSSEGDRLAEIVAFSAIGEAATGAVQPLDEAALPNVAIPASGVTVALAAPGTPLDQIEFAPLSTAPEGHFAHVLDVTGRSGVHELWAKACVGDRCGATARSIDLGGGENPPPAQEDTALQLMVEGSGSKRVLSATLTEADAPATGIAGRTISFFADGVRLGSGQTDSTGTAILNAPPRYRGGSHTFEARFDGDTLYRASAAASST